MNHFRSKAILAALLFLFVSGLRADEAATLFNDANKLFEQGKFSEASIAYEKLIDSGSISAPVYFNSGNAFYKSGQLGRAIAAYRSAEKLSPRDPDVRANLRFVRDQAGGATRSATRWENPIGRLTLDEWTIVTATAMSLWFLLLAFRQFRFGSRKSFRGGLIILGLASIALVLCLGAAIRQEILGKSAVVTVPEAVVRRGPLEESQSAFTLRDGAEISVIDQKGDWLHIVDAAKRTGWLLQRQTVSIGKRNR